MNLTPPSSLQTSRAESLICSGSRLHSAPQEFLPLQCGRLVLRRELFLRRATVSRLQAGKCKAGLSPKCVGTQRRAEACKLRELQPACADKSRVIWGAALHTVQVPLIEPPPVRCPLSAPATTHAAMTSRQHKPRHGCVNCYMWLHDLTSPSGRKVPSELI